MYFSRSLITALLSLSAPLLALAKENPFTNTQFNVQAGQSFTLKWNPTTGGTVSLVLRKGNNADLETVTTIASNIDNNGSYMWDVPSDIPRDGTYAVEIVDDQHPDDSEYTNYTTQFAIDSDVVPTASASSSGMSTAASTLTPSAFPLPSGITIDTSYYPSTGSASSTASDSMTSSMSMSSGSSMSMSMSMTDSASQTTMMSSTMTGTSSSDSSSTSTTDSDLQATAETQSDNGAAKATAMAGMLGMVALGALAL